MSSIVYIGSGKVGIHRFTFNELYELEKNKINFILCLTQLKIGPWMPLKRWCVHIAKKKDIFFQIIHLFFFKSNIFFDLFYFALKNNLIPYLFIALSFYKNIRKKNITSIHCQMGDNKLFIGYFLKKLIQKPLTVTVHAHELYQRNVYDNPSLIIELYSHCDKVFTVSDFNAGLISKKFLVPKSKIKLMRLFPLINQSNLMNDKIKILVVGNFVKKKGYEILIQSIKLLSNPNVIVWIVGGQTNSYDSIIINDLIKKYQVEDSFMVLGSLKGELLDIVYYACDIFCLPSCTDFYEDGNVAEREGIPVALMEAMAWKKPVITTRHAGIPELVDSILVEEGNINELKDAINMLIKNKSDWKKLGQLNAKIVNNKFNKSNIGILIDTFKSFDNQ